MRRLSIRALTATIRLEPDIDMAAISGRSANPNAGTRTPAAIGSATLNEVHDLLFPRTEWAR